jgi:elongation factor G
LWRIQADRREQLTEVRAGDICGVIGLRFSVTGDTLCDVKHPILLEPITFADTVISMAIEPENAEEYKKLKIVLDMMKRQDPTFRVDENDETGQVLISGMGELHLEVIKNWLLRTHKVNVRIHNPRVSYRESIQRTVNVTGICNRSIAGARHYAELTIKMEPLTNDSQAVEIACEYNEPEFVRLCKQVVLESLREEGQGGGNLGFPLINVRMTVTGAVTNESETSETALHIAASEAFRKGLQDAGIVLLEPIMRLEVSTPEDYVGDIVNDLQQRRAIVTHTEIRSHLTVIVAEAPLANLFGYSSAMRGLSQGRASSSMMPLSYGPAPPEVVRSFSLE